MEELQQISQHFLASGCDKLRFANPQRGIFGAVPGEILHVILLGWTTSSGLVAKLTTWQSGLEVRITVVFLSAYH